jgi:sec-independent protein translocase protein TatA
MPLGLHLPELLAVLAVALLIFGPKKLPEMGASIGKSIKAFKKGMKEINEPEETDLSVTKLDAIEREIASKRSAAAAAETRVD